MAKKNTNETHFQFPKEGTPYDPDSPQIHQYSQESPENISRQIPEAANQFQCPIPSQRTCETNAYDGRFDQSLFPQKMQGNFNYLALKTPPPTAVTQIFSDTMPYHTESIQEREFDYYLPNCNPRGVGLIFINKAFPNVSIRPGTQKDQENFEEIFTMMGLKTYIFEDKTREWISNELKTCEKYFENMTMYLFCVAFSTHGNQEDMLYCSDGLALSLRRDILPHFKPDKCQLLRGVPKVFIIQACRGEKIDEMRPRTATDAMVKDELVSLESDFLISYACPPEHKAFRSEKEGAWFINELNRAYKSYSDKYHFLDILTITNQLMLKRASENCENVAQSSHIDSTLKKFLWIRCDNHVTRGNELLEISQHSSIHDIDSAPKALNSRLKNGTEQAHSDTTPTNPPLNPQFTSDLSPKTVYDFDQRNKLIGELVEDNGLYLKMVTPKCQYLQSYDLGAEEFKGLGIIIVNHKCANVEREGSKSDVENLKHVFEGLKLKIEIAENLNAQEGEETIKSFIKSKIEKNLGMKSFFLAISTHGDGETRIVGAEGANVEINTILNLFKVEELISKPKIIFIQACRGENQEIGEKIFPDAISKCTRQSDLLVAYACVHGYRAMRNELKGSWFVTSLRECYDMLHGHSNILELLTATNKYMLETFEEKNDFVKMKQSAEFKNTLSCLLDI